MTLAVLVDSLGEHLCEVPGMLLAPAALDRHAGSVGDADFKELERLRCETGSALDEVAWLRVRVRSGGLDPRARATVAVAPGIEPALLIRAVRPPVTPDE